MYDVADITKAHRTTMAMTNPAHPDTAGLRRVAKRIADESPWVGWDTTTCFSCNSDQLNSRREDDDPDQHREDCAWLALRAALAATEAAPYVKVAWDQRYDQPVIDWGTPIDVERLARAFVAGYERAYNAGPYATGDAITVHGFAKNFATAYRDAK